MTFPLNEMYGYSRLCDRLRSSAITWKQLSLRSSAIYDRNTRSSAIVCDHMETSLFLRLVNICSQTIADRRSQKVLRSSAIIWKQTSPIACDPAIAEDRTIFYLLGSYAIICDRLRSCDHMKTKVRRSAIEMYLIIYIYIYIFKF